MHLSFYSFPHDVCLKPRLLIILVPHKRYSLHPPLYHRFPSTRPRAHVAHFILVERHITLICTTVLSITNSMLVAFAHIAYASSSCNCATPNQPPTTIKCSSLLFTPPLSTQRVYSSLISFLVLTCFEQLGSPKFLQVKLAWKFMENGPKCYRKSNFRVTRANERKQILYYHHPTFLRHAMVMLFCLPAPASAVSSATVPLHSCANDVSLKFLIHEQHQSCSSQFFLTLHATVL